MASKNQIARTPAQDHALPTVWHALSVEQTATELRTDGIHGLADSEVAVRRNRYGRNTVATTKQRSVLSILVHQFRSLIVALLITAGVVSLALGEIVEAVAILIVIALNAVIGFATEWKADKALNGLRQETIAQARVVRDGEERLIPAEQLVPGDIVLLGEGDRVPADGRVIEQAQLQIDEAALTGESLPVAKSTAPLDDPHAALGDRMSMVHLGTAVNAGRGKIIITATGPHTEMGKIGTLIADVDEHVTPLEAKLAQLSRALLVVVLALCVIIILIGWLRGNGLLYMVEVGVSLAIAAVPEGLLAVTTMTLAVGMQRMAKLHALVRRLPAVESLGSTTVICTDKTGTLTRNEMTVRAFHIAGQRVAVTGSGYAAQGEFSIDAQRIEPAQHAQATLLLALRIGALCNDAKLEHGGASINVLGDPTEAALIVAADKAGLDHISLQHEYPRTAEIPFDSVTKRMTTVHRMPDGQAVAYVKGSPAQVLNASVTVLGPDGTTPLTTEARAQILAANQELASAALRVLGLAYRVLPANFHEQDWSGQLTFVGLVAMSDPLRDEARSTLDICRAAGIRAVMITGDQQATAAEIARQLGLDKDLQGKPLRTVHARDLVDLSEAGWQQIVSDAAVFARVSPEQKLQIVAALQGLGHVVAMTGDGVNDAPALRKADIGIAMGIRGTEVAKAAAAMVITDDNFATIVGAVEQGRIIVNNIQRFIHYLFSCNFAEILTVFVAIMIGWPLPLGVLQILWLNLVTDIFPALALALEPSAPDVMKRPPRDPKQPIMTLSFAWLIVWQGVLLATCTLTTFFIAMRWYGTQGAGLRHAVTIAFMVLSLAQTMHALNARSQTRSIFTARMFANRWVWAATALCILLQLAAVYVPFLRKLLHTEMLTAADWALICAGCGIPIIVVELVKLTKRLRLRAKLPAPASGSLAAR